MRAILRRRRLPHIYMQLAIYNAERARGIVHSACWREQMAELQHDYDQWNRREAEKEATP